MDYAEKDDIAVSKIDRRLVRKLGRGLGQRLQGGLQIKLYFDT